MDVDNHLGRFILRGSEEVEEVLAMDFYAAQRLVVDCSGTIGKSAIRRGGFKGAIEHLLTVKVCDTVALVALHHGRGRFRKIALRNAKILNCDPDSKSLQRR